MPEPEIPEPNGCAICGEIERLHGWSWEDAAKFHQYAAPTDRQRIDRMKARRAARNAARKDRPASIETTATISADETAPFIPAIEALIGKIDLALWGIEARGGAA